MTDDALFSVSPLDGRYARITAPLKDFFSEAALIRYRLQVEVDYLLALSHHGVIRKITPPERALLMGVHRHTPLPVLQQIKTIEASTHHDVKAVEYYLQTQLINTSLKDLISFIHFGLTSNDINNLSYRLMVKNAQTQVLLPSLSSIVSDLGLMIKKYARLPMLARTHGQPAIPTTLGKEFSVFAIRLIKQLEHLEAVPLTGKVNGAVGGYHAQVLTYPNVDWLELSDAFIKKLKLKPNRHTTQINAPDDLIHLLNQYHLINTILISLCQDIWRYISDDWLIQKGKQKHVGSSTMPQKINPIEFENAEGNLTLANGMIETLTRKLPISRLQRDLSDSTVMRNLGVVIGHSLIAYQSLTGGLKSIAPNPPAINAALNRNYAILGEALQTYLRSQGQSDAYEIVAQKFKTNGITQKKWQNLTRKLAPLLQSLTPQTYLGLAPQLALAAHRQINQYLRKALYGFNKPV